jgi:hypothetical protein
MMVPVTLRYRPGSDVLVGVVHVDAVDPHSEPVDADTNYTWAAVDGSDQPVLVGFQLVFAGRRDATDDLPIPAALQPAVQRLFQLAVAAVDGLDDAAVRVRAKAETTTAVPLAALVRSAITATPRRCPPLVQAMANHPSVRRPA